MTAPAILLVEDDPELRALTSRALADEGYAVRSCSTAAEMWIALRAAPADLVLLDIMLPGTSGIEVCQRLRAESKIPIIFVSAKGSEADKMIGLELGADDYIPKPFSTRELVARIRAVMRRGGSERAQADRGQGFARFAGWTVSFPRREVTSPTRAIVDLTGAEFDVLAALIDHAGRVVARERLIELSRSRMGDNLDRSVDVLISRIRRKLSIAGTEDPIITIRGVGYMLAPAVERS